MRIVHRTTKFIAGVRTTFVLPPYDFPDPTSPFLYRNRAKGNDFFREIRRHGSLGSVKARGRNKSAKPRLKSMPRGRLARIERGEAEREIAAGGRERRVEGRKRRGR